MLSLLSHIAAVLAGLALLIWSADKFVEGAAAMAHLLGVSVMIIGITIVGFGTSAPEIVVSIVAVLQDTPDIAIGNALGSNIANIGLILGITAILAPIPIATRLFKAEYPLLALATVLMTWSLFDLTLDIVDGFALFGLLLLSLHYLIREHRRNPAAYAREEHAQEEMIHDMKMPAAIGWLLLGLVVLVGSSKLLVWGASNIAQTLGVSELIIGLTIVALGTSLPELAASIASLKKGKPDLAIGNVIGSNLFNSLAVIGLPALFTTFSIDAAARARDLPIAIGLTLVLLLMSRFPAAIPRHLTRVKGIFLFAAFVIYQLYLYYQAAAG
ncbi:MAG: calcium/sodium antiporter [Gammaproteobacteria bacterium]|nr:calcium/sodium antiporter [Gammaproteobacteria bacterium]MDH3857652.1 calcium/sodium antiporter [Gammaproteobacteria bacterium]